MNKSTNTTNYGQAPPQVPADIAAKPIVIQYIDKAREALQQEPASKLANAATARGWLDLIHLALQAPKPDVGAINLGLENIRAIEKSLSADVPNLTITLDLIDLTLEGLKSSG